MKKLLFIIICIVSLAQASFCQLCIAALCPAVYVCEAESESAVGTPSSGYARAAVTDGYFFTRKDLSSSIFAVPYTYCVQVIRDEGEWYYVKYAEDSGIYRALYGYVLRDDFTILSEKPDVTYLYKPVTVTYRADDSSSSLPVLGEITVEAAFYGTFYSGATAYSYVLCQGTFGYIQGANDDYPLNITEEDKPGKDEEPNGESVNSGMVTAIVLVALAAGALILLFVTTRKHDKAG